MAGVRAYLGMGSNLGDRAAHLDFGVEAVGRLPGTRVVAVSSVIETAPVGPIEQGAYLNGALAIETELPPRELLEALQSLERARGRDRRVEARWGPRTLDLDILVYAGLVLDEPGLTIPHPRAHLRRFVLGPLAELAPELVLPGQRRTVRALLACLDDSGAGGVL